MHTVDEMFDRYIDEVLPELSQRTQTDYGRHIKTLRQHFGTKDVRDVTRKEITEFMDVPRGKIQRNRALAVLSAGFRAALSWNWVEGNPCSYIERHETRHRSRNLTIEEFEAAKSYATRSRRRKSAQIALIMDLALHTGRSQRDILNLRWAQIDQQAGTILFANAYFRKGTHTKKRTVVPITSATDSLLVQARKLCGEHEFVVTTGRGTRYTSEGFRAMFQRLVKEWEEQTGNIRFTFHDIVELSRKSFRPKAESHAPDPLDNYPQFDAGLKSQAAAMTPYYGLFFCLERSIRGLVTNVLQTAVGPGWWDSNRIPTAIRQEVASLVEREIDSAVMQRSLQMIDYTTFGQLWVIIRENWDLFGGRFTSKSAVGNVMNRLNLARGPIAHCCPMSEHEIDRLRLTVYDWFNTLTK